MTTPLLARPRPLLGLRWYICALLFLATTICYIDRTTVAVLADTLKSDLNLNDAHYGWINFAFSTSYAIMYTIAGRLIDFLGARAGFAIAVFFWSLAAMAHAFARGPVGLAAARFALGVGEAANFPASIKTVAEYFPKHERAFATGIFNAGSNVGIMLSFVTVWIAHATHWQWAFLFTGALGLFWVALWLFFYRPLAVHSRVSDAERAYIRAGQPVTTRTEVIPWTMLLRQRAAWPYLIGKFLTDPVWWFYLYWLALYLKGTFHFTEKQVALWLIVPYLSADFGSVFAGWLSGHLIKRGWSIAPARYAAMGLCAACMPCALVAIFTNNFALALTMISFATAGHQGWSANIYTTATDMFPTRVAGSITGLGGTFGAIGGMLMTLAVGISLEYLGSHPELVANKYLPVFIWAGLMHPLALALYFLFLGKRFPEVNLDGNAPQTTSPPLLIGGLALAALGATFAALALYNWSYVIILTTPAGKPPSPATAAAVLTLALFVTLLGLALLYASAPKRAQPT